jgi:hypothetical protein
MKPVADEISLGRGHAAVVTLNGIELFDLRGSGFRTAHGASPRLCLASRQ